MRVFLQLNFISAAFGFLFFISGFMYINRTIWSDAIGIPQEVFNFILILLWITFLIIFFKVTKNRLVGSYWLLLSTVLWFPYMLIWSLTISSVIPDGMLQDNDDYGMGLLLLFASVFVFPLYTAGLVYAVIIRARGMGF